MFKKLIKKLRHDDGIAVLEMSILAAPFMFIMVAAAQLGHFAATQSEFVRMSSEAARIVNIEPNISTANLRTRLMDHFVFLDAGVFQISTSQTSLSGRLVRRLQFDYTHSGGDFPMPFERIDIREIVYVP